MNKHTAKEQSLASRVENPRVTAKLKLKKFLLECKRDAEQQSLTQSALAAKLEKTRAQINKVFLGSHVCSLVTLEAVAQALGGELQLVYVPKRTGRARKPGRMIQISETYSTKRSPATRRLGATVSAESVILPVAASPSETAE
ncbi:helix-turn-helix transcriptional regulator [bacterium]|nr:helix-turn-helix transcriptional regulator [bacterium]